MEPSQRWKQELRYLHKERPMCNCSTAYYLIAAPVIVTVFGLIAAIVITHIQETIEIKRKKVRQQGEMTIRDMLYVAVHLRLLTASDISNHQVETFNTRYNQHKDVLSLPELTSGDNEN